MSYKGGNIIHQGGYFVFDRIQTAGPGDLNIPEEKIYELGNFESVETVYDLPEVSFDAESYDMSTEFECWLINEDAATFPAVPGPTPWANEIDFRKAVPGDIISPSKSRRGQFDITTGAILPYLTLESFTYRFGVGENSTQSATLRGSSIFYTPGQPWYEEFTHTGPGNYALTHTADEYSLGANSQYVLGVTLVDTATKAYRQLFFDPNGTSGYTSTASQLTIIDDYTSDYDIVRVVYGTSAGTSDYPQIGSNYAGNPVHVNSSVKPGAVRGKDIWVYIGTPGPTPTWTKMTGVQSFEATWSATLENDEELGNDRYVSTEYDVPEVSGTVEVKPVDPRDFFDKISQITGVSNTEVIGPNVTTPVPLRVEIRNPSTQAVMKTIYIPDAKFQVPGYSGQANSSFTASLSYSSEGGNMLVYNGAR